MKTLFFLALVALSCAACERDTTLPEPVQPDPAALQGKAVIDSIADLHTHPVEPRNLTQ